MEQSVFNQLADTTLYNGPTLVIMLAGVFTAYQGIKMGLRHLKEGFEAHVILATKQNDELWKEVDRLRERISKLEANVAAILATRTQ